MNTIYQSQVFFFISSIGFIILFLLVAVCLFYIIKAVRSFHRIMDKIEGGVENISEATADMLEEMKESTVFRFLFSRRRKSRKSDK